jgi:hypothetical protein
MRGRRTEKVVEVPYGVITKKIDSDHCATGNRFDENFCSVMSNIAIMRQRSLRSEVGV